MTDQPINDPALAFALYASVAATTAIAALRAANLVDSATIDLLSENLTKCRQIAGNEPRLIEHAELLTDVLLMADAQRSE